jgi:phosphoribosylanthranilate isomerase
MSLTCVSFVGVDNNTNLDDLVQFKTHTGKRNEVFYEFSVLYSFSGNGNDQRYPTHNFSVDFLKFAKYNNIVGSLHLCGTAVSEYLNQDQNIIDLCKNANRIQLNINMKNHNDIKALAKAIVDITQKYHFNVILQKNDTKNMLNQLILDDENVDIQRFSLLNDSSGGFGKQISQIDPPHKNHFTGYAGGIDPDNVLHILSSIDQVNADDRPYYIDMESGIRTNNVFSIEKCQIIKNLIENRQ